MPPSSAFHPPIDGFPSDPELSRHLGDGETIPDNAEHGVITLFHFADLREHLGHLLIPQI
jgi:hypothetical protein